MVLAMMLQVKNKTEVRRVSLAKFLF